MKKIIPQKIKNGYHLVRSIFSVSWFGFPAKKIKVIGVTGTNGKTTTVQMIAKILKEAGYKVAVSSTINFIIGEKEWVNKTKFTTRSAWYTQKFIHQAVEEGCEYLVLEVASHALDQNRLWGIKFDVAVITNVTREHLDYHHTMSEYRKVKSKLFKFLKRKGQRVVNLEMENPAEFLAGKIGGEKYGFYKEKKDELVKNNKNKIINKLITEYDLKVIKAKRLKINLDGTEFVVKQTKFVLKLIGEFNVENALAAIGVGLSQGIDLAIISQALRGIKKVSGRMDSVANNRGLHIIIDYAVTPDAMEKLGKLILKYKTENVAQANNQSNITPRKLIWVFGACGERDRGKRPIMGKIVSRYADYAIVTNEDPYHEDPQQIINEVFGGIKNMTEGERSFRIMDRKKAIKKALNLAQKGDIVLVTGKGAEETMAVGHKRLSWNDRKVVKGLLEKNI